MKLFSFLILSFWLIFNFPLLAAAEATTESPSASSASSTTGPENNPLCWSEDACEKDYTGDGKNDGEWNNTDPKAAKQCGGGAYGYCYPIGSDYKLNVALPNGDTLATTVSDVGDYINKMYLFMLGVAATFAVVRIMAAGVQYIAFPKGGEVSKAMEKISGALTGLVILSCAALMLATINPNMIRLDPPRLPKIRTFVYFGDNARCESYKARGYAFEEDLSRSTKSTCGKKGKITKDKNGQVLGQSIDCFWTGCLGDIYTYSESGVPPLRIEKTCLPEVNGQPACVSCEELVTDPPFSSLKPSEQTCTQLQPIVYAGAPGSGKELTNDDASTSSSYAQYHFSCQYNRDFGFEPSEAYDTKTMGQCAVVAYDCNTVKSSGCSGYDGIKAWNKDGSQKLKAFESPGYFYDYSFHKSICENNPCGIDGGCKQEISAGVIAATAGVNIYFPPTAVLQTAISSLSGSDFTGVSCISVQSSDDETPSDAFVDTGFVGGG
jgi:hypothetical protein